MKKIIALRAKELKNKGMGRPPAITSEKLKLLEEAFLLGCTDAEACFHADIAETTLYAYQLKNPAFTKRKEQLKQAPYYRARKTFVSACEQPEFAVKYLERKKKDEFSLRTEHEINATLTITGDHAQSIAAAALADDDDD